MPFAAFIRGYAVGALLTGDRARAFFFFTGAFDPLRALPIAVAKATLECRLRMYSLGRSSWSEYTNSTNGDGLFALFFVVSFRAPVGRPCASNIV